VKPTILWGVVAAVTLAAAISASAREVVEIRLRGHYFAEPATVRITVAVEPAANHRALVIEADSEHYYRSSALALSGEMDKRLHSVEFKNLPAGNYILRAQVRSREAVLGAATQELTVTGVGER
jgi:hypothetical protein